MSEVTSKATHNMHKFVYLANEYKGSKTAQLYHMFQMPLLDYEAAAYLAQDLGFVKITEKVKGDFRFEVVSLPEKIELDADLHDLIKTLTYVFKRLEKKETDLEQGELTAWMEGYPTHDQFIAMKWLLNEGVLGTYEIVTRSDKKLGLPDTTRTMFCVAGNESKRWGEKQVPNKSLIVR